MLLSKMKTVTVEINPEIEANLNKIRDHKNESYETLIKKAVSLMEHFMEDEETRRRIKEIEKNPSVLKSEEELNRYFKKRGVKID